MNKTRPLFLVSLFLLIGLFACNSYADGVTIYRDTLWELHVAQGMKWVTEGDEDTQVKYIGEVKDGVPHGQGVETFKGITTGTRVSIPMV